MPFAVTETDDTGAPILVFDGLCPLCHGWVAFMLRHERRPRLRFVSAESATGSSLLHRHGFQPDQLTTFVFIDNGRLYTHSDAALRMARELTWPWRWLAQLARRVPRPLRDGIYNRVARNRYRWYGRLHTCPLPPAAHRHRFLA